MNTPLPFRGSEAVRAGELTWGALRGRDFRRLARDVYVDAAVLDSPVLAVRVALVRAGPGAVATGWSACVAFGLDVAPGPRPVEVTAGARRARSGGSVLVHQQVLDEDDVTTVDGMRVTTALRTAFELACRSGPDRSAVHRVLGPLSDAVVAADALARLGGFGGAELAELAARRPGVRGVTRVGTVASLLDPRSDSPPETRARIQAVLAGLPRPVAQHPVGRFALDLAWPEYRVALEYDGHHHALDDRRGRDLDRLDALRRDGWIVLVVTARQLARPHWVPDQVREALCERGWTPGPDAGRDWAGLLRENAARA